MSEPQIIYGLYKKLLKKPMMIGGLFLLGSLSFEVAFPYALGLFIQRAYNMDINNESEH